MFYSSLERYLESYNYDNDNICSIMQIFHTCQTWIMHERYIEGNKKFSRVNKSCLSFILFKCQFLLEQHTKNYYACLDFDDHWSI